jgi:hypothetical protein
MGGGDCGDEIDLGMDGHSIHAGYGREDGKDNSAHWGMEGHFRHAFLSRAVDRPEGARGARRSIRIDVSDLRGKV